MSRSSCQILSGCERKAGITYHHPSSMCVLPDACGTIVVADTQSNTLRFISCPNGQKKNVYELKNASFLEPRGICISEDGKCIIVCDTGHHKLKLVSLPPAKRKKTLLEKAPVSIFAGGRRGLKDGSLLEACFNSPHACCVHPDGSVFVADTGNHSIRRIGFSEHETVSVVTIAGGLYRTDRNVLSKRAGHQDGIEFNALFRSPMGICALENGEILVADTFNHCIRRLSAVADVDANYEPDIKWQVTTIAGSAQSGHQDGNCEHALFNQPTSICVASDGTFIVADKGNCCIRQIGSQWVRTITIDQPAPSALFSHGKEPKFQSPRGVCCLPSTKSWYTGGESSNSIEVIGVCDTGNNLIRVVSLPTELKTQVKPKKKEQESIQTSNKESEMELRWIKDENERLRAENALYLDLLKKLAVKLENLTM